MEEPTQEQIRQLLYTMARAKDVLTSAEIHASWVENVVIGSDRYVTIHYRIDSEELTHVVGFTAFLMPFWSVRRHRSSGYRVVLQEGSEPRVAVCRDTQDPDKQPHQCCVDEGGIVVCGCEDYAKQKEAFQEQPVLWNLIGQQPRCKHVFASAVLLEREDVLRMPMIASPIVSLDEEPREDAQEQEALPGLDQSAASGSQPSRSQGVKKRQIRAIKIGENSNVPE